MCQNIPYIVCLNVIIILEIWPLAGRRKWNTFQETNKELFWWELMPYFFVDSRMNLQYIWKCSILWFHSSIFINYFLITWNKNQNRTGRICVQCCFCDGSSAAKESSSLKAGTPKKSPRTRPVAFSPQNRSTTKPCTAKQCLWWNNYPIIFVRNCRTRTCVSQNTYVARAESVSMTQFDSSICCLMSFFFLGFRKRIPYLLISYR